MNKAFLISVASAALLLASPATPVRAAASAEQSPAISAGVTTASEVSPSTSSGYIDVNGIHFYYESHGIGEPLILLHGGLMHTGLLGPLPRQLARNRRVIAIDLQGHGRTGDVDRPLRFEAMADDVAALIGKLGLGQVDIMGYSVGGGVALRTAIQHPALVRKLVLVAIPFSRDGWYPDVLAGMAHVNAAAAEPMKPSPVYQTYAAVAPQPENFPKLLDKTGALINSAYDWSSEVAALKAPTMLVYADHDAVAPEHMIKFFQLLGGGKKDAGWDGSGMTQARLAILPGRTHYDLLMAPALVATVDPFLGGPVTASAGQ